MSFLDEVKGAQSPRNQCKTCSELGRLDADLIAEVELAMTDDEATTAAIVRVLNKRTGSNLFHESSFGRHRKGRHVIKDES